MNLARKADRNCLDGYENVDMVEAIIEGDLSVTKIDECWMNVAGDNANFGEYQWHMAYFLARQKLVLIDSLRAMFDVVEAYADEEIDLSSFTPAGGNGRRLDVFEKMFR